LGSLEGVKQDFKGRTQTPNMYGGLNVLKVQMVLVATKQLNVTTRWQGWVTKSTFRPELLAAEKGDIK